MNNEYTKQANDFIEKTNTVLTVVFLKQGKYFDDDKYERDIYQVMLVRGSRSFTFTFGQSVIHSGRFVKYGKPERGISQGVKTAIGYQRPYPFDEWEKNNNFEVPTAYDILSALQKYDTGTFEEFCAEFGYDTDSRKAEKTYEAVKNEYTQLCALYNESEMESLREIV